MQRRQLVPVNQFGNNHIQQFSRYDPYQQVQRMMMSFGGFNNDLFLNSIMMSVGDPFEDMFKFSDMHKNVHSRGVQGSYVFQSYVSSSKIGPNGQVTTQNYFQNNLGEHRGGNTISQKQQAYKNSSGVNRIAEQRMLNDRGRKIVREKIGNSIQQTNHYYNIDEEQAAKFDSDWRQTDQNLKFLETQQAYLKPISQPRLTQFAHDGRRKQLPTVPFNFPQHIQVRPDRQKIQSTTQRVLPAPQQPSQQPYQQPYQQVRVQQPLFVNSRGGQNFHQSVQKAYGYPIQKNHILYENGIGRNGGMYPTDGKKF